MRGKFARLLLAGAMMMAVASWALLVGHHSTAPSSGHYSTAFAVAITLSAAGPLIVLFATIRFRQTQSVVAAARALADQYGLGWQMVVLPVPLSAAGAQVMAFLLGGDTSLSQSTLVATGFCLSLFLYFADGSRKAQDGRDRCSGPVQPWYRRGGARSATLAMVGLTIAAAWVRAIQLRSPLRCDEAYTAVTYATSLANAWLRYDTTNNHFLYSFLALGSRIVFGDNEFAIRLPAFLFSVACIPLTYFVAQPVLSEPAALLACVAVALSPLMVHYGYDGRGYSANTAFALATVLFLCRWLALARQEDRRAYILFAVLAFALLPTTVYLFAAVTAASLIITLGKKKLAVAVPSMWRGHLAVLAWVALVYVNPLTNRVLAGFSVYPNEWGTDQVGSLITAWANVAVAPGPDVTTTTRALRGGTALGVAFAVLYLFVQSASWLAKNAPLHVARDSPGGEGEIPGDAPVGVCYGADESLVGVMVASVVCVPVVLMALQTDRLHLPYVRHFAYLTPFVMILAAQGWERLGRASAAGVLRRSRVARRNAVLLRYSAFVVLALALVTAYLPTVGLETSPVDAGLTYGQAPTKDLAGFLAQSVEPGATVKVAGGCVEPIVRYYLRHSPVASQIDSAYSCHRLQGRDNVFFVPTWDMSLEQFSACNEDLEDKQLVFDQGGLSVWHFSKAAR